MSTSFLDQFARVGVDDSAAVGRRLEAGESARSVGESLGLDPGAVVAAIAQVGLGPEGSDGPSLIQVAPSRPRLAEVIADESTIADLFPRAGRPARLALGAGLLQVLDAWEASHTAAQAADDLGESVTSAAWHMVAHRREPDADNARYWARRVRGAVFGPLTTLVAPLLRGPNADRDWASRLLAGNPVVWNPATMIDFCGRVEPGSAQETLARRLQRLEMLVLLYGSITALDG